MTLSPFSLKKLQKNIMNLIQIYFQTLEILNGTSSIKLDDSKYVWKLKVARTLLIFLTKKRRNLQKKFVYPGGYIE